MTSLVEVYRRWPTHTDCIAHLEAVRWGGHPLCPYCGADRIAHHRELERDNRWQCQRCDKSFSVTVGTIFHRTHVDLQKWFLLISLMLNAKKGLSAMQAARDLDMRRPTVWSMMHRIRAALDDDGELLTGLVEMDETYVGGKRRKANHRDDDTPGPRGTAGKTAVVGAIERKGRVKTVVTSKSEMTGSDLEALTREMVDINHALLTTDEHAGYNGLNKFVAHRTINHSKAYSERDLFSDQFGATHTNTIESFWAILKRAILGQYHHISRKYLALYMREISYRYNMRQRIDAFAGVLHLAVKP
jgi:transposase-like protein